ncbi:diguanylate cyclase [Clostridium sp. YIM B02515]|uniref:Diguanylate cyclase n=1 Tax=Clostridium rhizosphaerae TaxID=2803861 RepID=A0ABS1TFQ8_9CLOT|nr:diguanylate cyclase [Clostridium rhizosphaerae]
MYKHIGVTDNLTGNQILVQISNTLKELLSKYNGIAGRLGGGEFVILIENLSEEEANNIVETLSNKLKDRYFDV